MGDEDKAKLRRNIIRNGGQHRRVVARELDPKSPWWPKDADPGIRQWQILDGHQTREILVDLGWKRINIDGWTGISDEDSLVLLATLNRLHGESVVEKQEKLLAALLKSHPATDLDEILVESQAEVEALVKRLEAHPHGAHKGDNGTVDPTTIGGKPPGGGGRAPAPPTDAPATPEGWAAWDTALIHQDDRPVIEAAMDSILDFVPAGIRTQRPDIVRGKVLRVLADLWHISLADAKTKIMAERVATASGHSGDQGDA